MFRLPTENPPPLEGRLPDAPVEAPREAAPRAASPVGGRRQRIVSVARKELLHILRDRATLMMTLFFPIVEMIMLGYAVDMNVRYIPTVVLDMSKTQESRALLQSFENSEDFKIINQVQTDAQLTEEIVAGRARVGIKIPENYSRRPVGRIGEADTSQVLVLVDGSLSSVAGEAVNVANAITLRKSLIQALGDKGLEFETRPRVLFNPDMYSANFFIPGLLIVLCQMMAVTLSANAIVREKEKGTLEQLFMTPVRPIELVLGKLTPYLVLTFIEFCGISLLMRVVFKVPIHGHFITLLALAFPFVLTCLAFGLLVSMRVSTREAAMQSAMATMMPSIFLSGYVFPLDSMPMFFWCVAQVIPTTWLIDASRGVILRGAGWHELWPHAVVLWAMALFVLGICSLKMRKQLA